MRMKRIIGICIMSIMLFPAITAQLPPPKEFVMDNPCFVDGTVFYPDGTPVERGVRIYVQNIDTGETFNTTTGHLHPPPEEYDNDYKTVFGCVYASHRVKVTAEHNGYHAEAETTVPETGIAYVDLTLKKEEGLLSSIKYLLAKIKRIFT